MQVPLSKPEIDDSDRKAVMDVLSGAELSLGPRLPAFEKAVCERFGNRFAIAVNSGTSGLHLCVKAAGIQDGDEVITTPFSFIASANCLLFERAIPVFVDVDPESGNIDPALIERAITPRTRGILPVHVFGRPCQMGAILEIAKRRVLTVIEDSCEAIGATLDGIPVGRLGQTGVFAFYPNKQITTGEGGIIVTDDEEAARLCRSWRNQGRDDGGAWLQHRRLGYNYRLSDLNCALGISQLARLDEIMAARSRVAELYNAALKDFEPLVLPSLSEPNATLSWFVYVVRLREEFSRNDRDRILRGLRAAGIGCNNYFTPIHLQPFYRDSFGFQEGDFPVTEHLADRTIALPFHNNLTIAEVEYVSDALRRLCHAGESNRVLVAAN
jgi:perosamine synthetase